MLLNAAESLKSYVSYKHGRVAWVIVQTTLLASIDLVVLFDRCKRNIYIKGYFVIEEIICIYCTLLTVRGRTLHAILENSTYLFKRETSLHSRMTNIAFLEKSSF